MAVLTAASVLTAGTAWGSTPALHAHGAPGALDAPDLPPAAAVLEFQPFQDQSFLAARKSGAAIVLYFEADWCAPCKEMHARTFREPAVVEAAAGIRFFRVDISVLTPYVGLVMKSFRVTGAPTVVVFGPDGKERQRRFGFIPSEDFVKMLDEGRKPSPSS